MKASDSVVEVQGRVVKILPGLLCTVKLENGFEILAHTSGKMRKFNIRLALGDVVTVEMSPYDLTKGRITYRNRA